MVRVVARRLNDLKLRDKMLLSFLLFMVLPLMLVGAVVIGEFRDQTLKEAQAQAEEGVNRIQRQSGEVLSVGRKIVERLAVDRNVETVLTTAYPSSLDVFLAYHTFDTFQLYRDISPDLTGIQAYVDNPTVLDNWEVRPTTDETRKAFWYQAAQAHPNLIGWFSWSDPTKSTRARLSLVRSLRYAAEGRSVVLVVDLDMARIETFLGQEGFETLLLDPNHVVVASNRSELTGRPLTDKRLLGLIAQGPSSQVFLRDLHPDGAFNGLQIVCVVSPEVILRSADRISAVGLTVLLAGTLVSLLFLWGVYTLFARRLERLSRQLPLVAAGDFDRELPVDGRDEIGQLAARFNTMVHDIRTLMAEVKEGHEAQSRLERAQGEIRLKMLASQINPHFLFNVLEALRMRAHLAGQKAIASTVKLLGRLMRRNLEASGGPITLGEELENVKCYLDIEKFRLEEKLEYRIDASAEALAVSVPPLILEPLVENAVVHGLERRYGGGWVSVEAGVEAGRLVVSVADNGLGMDEATRLHLFEGPEGHHVGLKNIDQRLRLTYGDAFGLTVASTEGQGTRVSFVLPLAPGAP